MQGSTHPRCSGTCGRDGKGRKLEGSLLHHASHNSDGHWWCSKCRSKGKPKGLQRRSSGGSSLVMPALLGIAMLGAAAASAALPLPAPNMQMQSHSDSAASISVAAALQHMSPLHRRDASLSFYDRYHSALLPASDRLKLNRHQQRRSERTSARILFYSLPYHIH